MLRRSILISVVCVSSAACVDSRELPPIPAQAEIAYGPKVYLVDATLGVTPAGNRCTRLGEVQPIGTSSTATVTPTDGLRDALGDLIPIDASQAHNCYVDVKEKTLRIDQIEATNELFQLCIDSGACVKPDPSKASKSQLCKSEDDFDHCPVVEVTHTQATNFCKWIGRRLPSMMEHIIARQGTANDDPELIPIYPTGAREESMLPNSCNDAVLGKLGCDKPAPMNVADNKGAALLDAVNGTKGQVFDTMGNASEWASDLMPIIRGAANTYPWFCQGPIMTPEVGQAPECPTGAVCVRGQYAPRGLPIGDYPVCVAFGLNLRAISGGHGSLMGGNFGDADITRGLAGVFSRRIEQEPDESPAKTYGFRCAGDVGVDDEVESSAR